MSQIYKPNAGGGGLVPIETINGDTGSITGSTVTIYANNAANQAGETVKFVNSGTISTFEVTDASNNTMVGKGSGKSGMSGNQNAAFGALALESITTGFLNTSLGYEAGNDLTTGEANTFVGNSSGAVLTTGSFNIIIGEGSGNNYSSSEGSNICIGNNGTSSESHVIRIGTQGSGNEQQNQCFIAGIVGVTVSNQKFVTINSSTGQMGVVAFNPSGFPWTDVTGATQTLSVNNGYVTDHTNVTYTLPATAALGDTIKIVGKLGLATITPNANQQILIGSASGTVGITGTAVATNVGDSAEMICITSGASSAWRFANFVGNWSLT